MKAKSNRAARINETRKRVSKLRKKYGKRKPKEVFRPGGKRSLEVARTLRLNREKALKMLEKKPALKMALLRSLGIDSFYFNKTTIERSKDTPAINIFIESYEELTNTSSIGTLAGVGKVAINKIYYSSEPTKQSERIHEETHTRTRILRDPSIMIKDKTKIKERSWQEKVLTEVISEVATEKKFNPLVKYQEVEILGEGVYGTRYYASMEFSPIFAKKKANHQKMQEMLEKKKTAISRALKVLPKGEVIMVLQQTSWGNLERDLRARAKRRKKK